MRKVRLYIAISLDGFIAKADGDIKWLEEIPNPDKSDHGYADFISEIDTVLMGNKTYQQVMGFGIGYPYPGKKGFVFTRNQDLNRDEHVKFIQEDPDEFTRKLKDQEGKDIWLIGGGQINTLLFNANLIDELMVFVMPIVIGTGIPLFGPIVKEQSLRLTESKAYSTGAVLLTYQLT